MTDEPTIPLDNAIATQRALRDALGLGEERFSMPEFIGMLSDEIEQLRDAGRDDAAIAALISDHAGMRIDAATVTEHYASPEERGFD